MKDFSLFSFIFLVFGSCTKFENNPEGFEGLYKTNAALDFRCVALDPGKLPTLKITKTGENTFTLQLNIYEPGKSVVKFNSVSLEYTNDSNELVFEGKKIGDWKVNAYLENKPKLVTINYANQSKPESFVYFVGEKK